MATSFAQRLASGQAVINKFAVHDIDAASIAGLLAELIAKFLPEDAEKISAAIDDAIAKRTKRKMARSIAAPRGSELRGLLKCRQWKCCPEVFNILIAEKASRYDCVNVSNWLRSKKDTGSGVDAKTGKCPPRADIVAVMNKGSKRKKRVPSKPLTPLQRMKADPKEMHADIVKLASCYASIVKDDDAAAYIKALNASLKSLTVFIVAADAETKDK